MHEEPKLKKQPTGDYPVGYCRTAQHTRWQKGGPSPNPKGRPKRKLSGDIGESVNNLLAETGWVEIDGKRKRRSNADKVALVRLRETFQGKPGAARDLYRWQQEYIERNPTEQETVITATLVFPEEENRLAQLAGENRQLRERIAQLESERGGPLETHRLPRPSATEDRTRSP